MEELERVVDEVRHSHAEGLPLERPRGGGVQPPRLAECEGHTASSLERPGGEAPGGGRGGERQQQGGELAGEG